MCNKCHPGGHYDGTLEQLNHDPILLELQNFPLIMVRSWWVCVKILFEIVCYGIRRLS